MKLVVGLGNPGAEYRETRHNVGFQVIDELASRWGLEQWRESFESLACRTMRGGEPVILCKPLTFMNLSGRAVAGVAGFYKVPVPDLLVVTDDVALPLGRLRARRGGSDGGHNGLKSIAQSLGTDAYARLRIGDKPVKFKNKSNQKSNDPPIVGDRVIIEATKDDKTKKVSATVVHYSSVKTA